MPVVALAEGANTATTLSSVITADMVTGVLDQLLSLLPVVLPAMITLLGIRKGISFVLGMLRSA